MKIFYFIISIFSFSLDAFVKRIYYMDISLYDKPCTEIHHYHYKTLFLSPGHTLESGMGYLVR